MTTIYDRIERGDYAPRFKYAGEPAKPDVLRKRAEDLTEEELRRLPCVKQLYEAAKKDTDASLARYREEQAWCESRFWDDLQAEHGVVSNDPFAERMRMIAWDHGHSSGYGDVAHAFEELVPLYELYAAAKRGEAT